MSIVKVCTYAVNLTCAVYFLVSSCNFCKD